MAAECMIQNIPYQWPAIDRQSSWELSTRLARIEEQLDEVISLLKGKG